MNLQLLSRAAAVAMLAGSALVAGAAPQGAGVDRPDRQVPRTRAVPAARPPQLHLDQRHRHDHYYPRPGHVVVVPPAGSVSIAYRNSHYFFHGGVWFRPVSGRFVVVMPPLGIVVPLLPPAYVTLWIGGAPFFYANGVYYVSAPAGGYVVVAPPAGAEAAQPAARVLPEPIIYPRDDQDRAQTDADRQECEQWAQEQPGAREDAAVMRRAFEACMDGRGYSVR